VVYVPDNGRNPPNEFTEVIVRNREEAVKILAMNGSDDD